MLGVVSFNELKKLYSESTIGIIPSLHEQCSYVAIEMSMFGLPIIVSDVDALSEMFEDEINALKIPLLFDEDFGLDLESDDDSVRCGSQHDIAFGNLPHGFVDHVHLDFRG